MNLSTPPAADFSTGAVAAEFQSFLADVEDLIQATTSLTGQDLVQARAKLAARVSAARESVEGLGDAAVDRARETAKFTNDWVSENPWPAIGIGAALGVMLGFVLARRR